ncbi:hypothetical protein TSAR_005767 [Trichomalopsis sarcophagae]|uniref:Uncharacterized protein n=1 Tax=Trichomalopsis sarcophagae TaxID=543379 RepID=A0A232EIS3_9HYME|nr:hypothetical protein TSAR_005767 [Trichomalopsis sarcophagae]
MKLDPLSRKQTTTSVWKTLALAKKIWEKIREKLHSVDMFVSVAMNIHKIFENDVATIIGLVKRPEDEQVAPNKSTESLELMLSQTVRTLILAKPPTTMMLVKSGLMPKNGRKCLQAIGGKTKDSHKKQRKIMRKLLRHVHLNPQCKILKNKGKCRGRRLPRGKQQ